MRYEERVVKYSGKFEEVPTKEGTVSKEEYESAGMKVILDYFNIDNVMFIEILKLYKIIRYYYERDRRNSIFFY